MSKPFTGKVNWGFVAREVYEMNFNRDSLNSGTNSVSSSLGSLEVIMEHPVGSFSDETHVSSDVATFGVGAVQVLATILTLWLADKSGRRLLLIVSSSAMALSLLVVSISFYLKVMVIAFSLGLGAMPWIIMSEILPINIKGLAGSFATLANWFFSWLVTLTANLLLDWSSGGTFTIYTAVCVFTAGFVAIWVPETKGKTLEEIQQFFR
ncbi:hypothetical protein KIW84_034586 [Lathyrus oleraceus]|uniref:Major facilitator superfamily (MFS) profile domain-containing protein n=2 Tax=Pisum sativum TaxID=3888 RepID=A0A9D4XZV1_PEA|nr:hypothetical protein KIW84_034586 [Pisum sativum]